MLARRKQPARHKQHQRGGACRAGWCESADVGVCCSITGPCGVVSHPVGVGVDGDSAPPFALHPLLLVQTQSVVKVTVGHRRVDGRLWKTNPLLLSSLRALRCSFSCVLVCFVRLGLLVVLIIQGGVCRPAVLNDHIWIWNQSGVSQPPASRGRQDRLTCVCVAELRGERNVIQSHVSASGTVEGHLKHHL